jgi:hydrogenase 3 maturation protease
VVRHRCVVEEGLRAWLSDGERVVIAGIGNPIRMDDFVGIGVVQNLRGKVSAKVCLLECETVPESFIQQIVDFRPTHVLLIDAAVMGLRPGDLRLIEPAELTGLGVISTHMLPLRIFCEYLMKTTKAKIRLLLIEPQHTDFGEGLSDQVEASAECIVNSLLKLLH